MVRNPDGATRKQSSEEERLMARVETPVLDRLDAARQEMQRGGIDLLLVTPSADLLYLIGRRGHAMERPILLAVTRDAPAVMLVPELEAPGIAGLSGITPLPYREAASPYALLHEALAGSPNPGRIAVSDQAWASVLLRLQQVYPDSSFLPASRLLAALRMVKVPEELELLASAGRRADAAFERLLPIAFAGRTEREIAVVLGDLTRDEGLEPADWGPIVGSGPNGASPHHGASERVIREGDAVVLDFGGVVEGYQADITRTVHVGAAGDDFRRAYESVRRAQEVGVESVRPGVTAGAVDRRTREVIREAGLAEYFIHRTGHGLGLEAHEEPYIIEGNDQRLEAGMVFSIEPGVYLPGRFGIRIEDIVAVTESGVTRLNEATRHLVIVH